MLDPIQSAAAHPVDDLPLLGDVAAVEGRAALEAARAYLREPPPPGRIRVYPAGAGAPAVRVDGDGWSLVGRAGQISFVLLDTVPTAHAISWKESPSLLEELSALALSRGEHA